jgi:hypothetical protein
MDSPCAASTDSEARARMKLAIGRMTGSGQSMSMPNGSRNSVTPANRQMNERNGSRQSSGAFDSRENM